MSSWAWSGRTFDCTPCFFTGYRLALVGTYLNWAVTSAAAAWGAGDTTMPLAAGGHLGTPDQELTLLVGLRALNVAMFGNAFWCCGACSRSPFTGH